MHNAYAACALPMCTHKSGDTVLVVIVVVILVVVVVVGNVGCVAGVLALVPRNFAEGRAN